jgi:enoyl-CoA hydratase/carnithine racemase
MSEPLVRMEQSGAVARVILNRPEARNALNRALCAQLQEVLDAVSGLAVAGTVRAATLQGAGVAFCAGADLKERASLDADAMSAHSAAIAACADRLEALPCPVVACVNGAALGGGLELALACDIRIVAADASLGFPELNYGFFPGAGGPVRLVRLVGVSTATYLIMSATRFGGEEALRFALANECVPAATAEHRGFELAERIAAFPGQGVAAFRKLLRDIDAGWLGAATARAKELREALNRDDAVRDALSGFGRRPGTPGR